MNLIDQLTLLALDDTKGTFVTSSMAYNYALAGAVIMELALENRIDLSGDKVRIKDKSKTGDRIIDMYFDQILQSKKERSMKTWVERIGNKASHIKNETIEKLIDQGILERKEDKILWIFTVNKFPTKNARPENHLRRRLYDVVVNHHHPELKEIMLLNLVAACDLEKEVFGKAQAKNFKKRMKTINESDQFSKEISKSVREICDAITAMLVVIIATSVVTTTATTS